jgi:hypothetical protein
MNKLPIHSLKKQFSQLWSRMPLRCINSYNSLALVLSANLTNLSLCHSGAITNRPFVINMWLIMFRTPYIPWSGYLSSRFLTQSPLSYLSIAGHQWGAYIYICVRLEEGRINEDIPIYCVVIIESLWLCGHY